MRRLSLSDTIFYNLGDCYIVAAFVLEGPCDPAALVAEFEGVVEAMPAMAEVPVRLGIWTFARRSPPIDLTRHIAVVRDASVTRIEDIIPRVDRLRRSPMPPDMPPWRVFVINPRGEATPGDGPVPLSAVLVQARHGLTDAIRGLQILGRMGRYKPDARHAALAARLPVLDPASLPGGITVHDTGLSLIQVPRRGMPRDGDASERFAAVAAEMVADAKLFPHAQPLRGNVGRTRLVSRRASEGGLGNHLKMVSVATGEAAERRRFRIPGLSRAQNLPLTQWLVALAPRRLARMMMRIWYSSFDAMATLLPLQRRLTIGGRRVSAGFGVPPLWGPVPLVMLAMADGENYNVTLLPGNGFAAERRALLTRIARLLNPETGREPFGLGAARAAGERRPARVQPRPATDRASTAASPAPSASRSA